LSLSEEPLGSCGTERPKGASATAIEICLVRACIRLRWSQIFSLNSWKFWKNDFYSL